MQKSQIVAEALLAGLNIVVIMFAQCTYSDSAYKRSQVQCLRSWVYDFPIQPIRDDTHRVRFLVVVHRFGVSTLNWGKNNRCTVSVGAKHIDISTLCIFFLNQDIHSKTVHWTVDEKKTIHNILYTPDLIDMFQTPIMPIYVRAIDYNIT